MCTTSNVHVQCYVALLYFFILLQKAQKAQKASLNNFMVNALNKDQGSIQIK